MYKKSKQAIHFIGIGGIGMSGIAEILFGLGFPISGSDLAEGPTVQRLRKLGLTIHIGHRSENIGNAKVVVYSSAVPGMNPEIVEARKRKIPIVPRAEMLAELMRLKYGVGIAGTHGKTTTTSLLGHILTFAQTDPTVIVGGKVNQLGGNAKLGSGSFLVAEADESDGSFLRLSPVLNIITNIDNDHIDHYGSLESLRLAFLTFANKVPYYGHNILCGDNEEIRKIMPLVEKPYSTYGFSEGNDFRIENLKESQTGNVFDIFYQKKKWAHLDLPLLGKHNVLNATAAMAAARELDIPVEKAVEALACFKGVGRRMEHKGQMKGAEVYDDYAHHPTEIAATIESAIQMNRRILIVFQPHRYTRTQLCWEQFPKAFSALSKKTGHQVFITDIYGAGEPAMDSVTSEKLTNYCQEQLGPNLCHYVGSLDEAAQKVSTEIKTGDIVISMGAGSITNLYQKLCQIMETSA